MESYTFQTDLQFNGHRPRTLTVSADGSIAGELGDEPVDVKSWKSPPHVALANMPLEPRMLELFSRRYGVLVGTSATYSDQHKLDARNVSEHPLDSTPTELLNLGVAALVQQDFAVTSDDFKQAQRMLRLAWHGDRATILPMMQAVKRAEYNVILPREIRNDLTILATRDLWKFTCFLFLLDHWAGRTNVCANQNCVTPYFIKQRKDQAYCKHACAVVGTNARRAAEKTIRRKK